MIKKLVSPTSPTSPTRPTSPTPLFIQDNRIERARYNAEKKEELKKYQIYSLYSCENKHAFEPKRNYNCLATFLNSICIRIKFIFTS